MLSNIETGAVKGVAVKSEWITDISNAAIMNFGNGIDSGMVIKRDGVCFNKHLVFMLVLPIWFSNLKAVDVATVSSVWFPSFSPEL
jgi:hypothetical protein